MLRKINALDKKLQHLEELFVTHLDAPNDLYKTTNSVRSKCENLDLYDSVRSLIDLANKLKDDVYKKNDIYYNNQNNSQAYKRIQVLVSELHNLSVYLEQLQNFQCRINNQNVQFDQRSNCLPYNATANICQNSHEELHPRELRYTNPKQKGRQYMKSKIYTTQQTNYSNRAPKNINYSRNDICHSPCRSHCFKFDTNNFSTVGQDDNNMLNFNRQYRSKQCNCQQIKSSSTTSVCSCNLCKNNNVSHGKEKKIHYRNMKPLALTPVCSCNILRENKSRHGVLYEQKLNNQRVQFTSSPKHYYSEKAFVNSKDRRNSQRRTVRRMYTKEESFTGPYFEETDIAYQKPVKTRNNYKKIRNRGKRNIPKKGIIGCYSKESQSLSTDMHVSKNEMMVNQVHIIEEKEQNKNKIENKVNTLKGPLNNISHYDIGPKQEIGSIETGKKQHQNESMIRTISFGNSGKQEITHSPKTEGIGNIKKVDLETTNNNLQSNMNKNYEKPTAFKTKTWYYHNASSNYSASESEETSSRNRHQMQGKRYLLRRQYRFPGYCKQDNIIHKRRYLQEELEELDFYKAENLMSKYKGRKGNQTDTIFVPVPLRFQEKKRNHSWNPKSNVLKYNSKYGRKLICPRNKYNKHITNNSYIYESDSYETDQGNENSFTSSSDITHNTSPEELIIFRKNNNVSSSIRNLDLRKIIDTLTDFETDICNECVIKERRKSLSPPELLNCKEGTNTKILIKKEVIKCPRCREKLEKNVYKVANKKENNVDLNSEHVAQTKITKSSDKELNSIHSNKIDKSKSYLKGYINENTHKEGVKVKSKTDAKLPSFQAKHEQNNLAQQSNLNDIKQSKPTEMQNFGNTININIERSSYSSENYLHDKRSKNSNNKENIMKREKTISFILPIAQEHLNIIPTDQILLPENKDKANNGIRTIFNTSNPKMYLAHTNSQQIPKSNLTTLKNESFESPSKSNLVQIVGQTATKMKNKVNDDKPKFTKLNIIAKVKDNQEKKKSLITVQDSITKTNFEENVIDNISICSKSQLFNINSVSKQNDKEILSEQTNKNTDSSFKQKNNTLFSNKDKDFEENKTISDRISKPINDTKCEISSGQVLTGKVPFIEKNKLKENQYINYKQSNEKNHPKEYQYINSKRYHRPLAFKKYSPLNKKLKENVAHKNKYKFNNLHTSSSAVNQSNTYNTGRRDNKYFKHKHSVCPKFCKDIEVIKRPVELDRTQSFYSDLLVQSSDSKSKCELVNKCHDLFNLTMTSESSFSTLDWEKVAKKLKEDKFYPW